MEARPHITPPDSSWDRLPPERQEALKNLARHLARISARVMAEKNIEVNMDDPAVAREMLQATFDAVFLSGSRPASRKGSRGTAPAKTRRKQGGTDKEQIP